MNKAQIAEALAARAGIPKVRATQYVDGVVSIISESLMKGEKVTISDFGTFTVSERRAFTGHNPKNGQEIQIPGRKIPVFRAGRGLKDALNGAVGSSTAVSTSPAPSPAPVSIPNAG